jgi:phosphatidylethanolamine-binding protein (PEBP) family uncharacterized protein
MRRPTPAMWSAMLLSVLALAGCSGSSAPKSLIISFKSPAVVHTALPTRYTCDGQDISPPMEWGAIPSTTRELALFVIGLTPNHGANSGYKTSVEWGIAGVSPSLHRLAAGELPPGAHVAVTGRGKTVHYSICPPAGRTKSYEFALYAVPASISVPAKFVGIKLLQLIANPESGSQAYAGGSFLATYTRPRHAAKRRQAQ